MISLQHEIFLEVAQQLSFTKASQILFLSQSAISKHVKALEAFYKTALFERHGNSISLTAAGQLVYDKVMAATQLKTELHEQIQQLNGSFSPVTRLAIGGSTTISLYVLPPVLSAYLRSFPNIQLQLINRNSTNIQKALLDHDIELGIVEGLPQLTTLTYTPFISDQVVAVCSPKSPLSKRVLRVAELTDVPLALREQGSGTLAAVQEALALRGIRPADLKVLVRLGGTEALKNFVLTDTCLAFLPKRAIQNELATGVLVEVPIEELAIQRDFYFIQRKGTENNPLVNAFIRFTQRYYSNPE